MRLNPRRKLIGAAVVLCGLLAVGARSGAAADVSDDVLQALIEHDTKQVLDSLKGGKPEKRSIVQIKSSAMMLAAYAQAKMAGKDDKAAALRANALKVAELVKGKKFAEAVEPAKALGTGKAAGATDAKALPLHQMHGFDVNELMAQYKKKDVGGLNVELDIKNYARKGGAKPEAAALIAGRVLVTADFVEKMEPDGGFAGGTKTQGAWDDFNKKMRAAAQELAATAKAKADAKKLQASFNKLDAACVGCHDVFK
jgi:hypothetical protein